MPNSKRGNTKSFVEENFKRPSSWKFLEGKVYVNDLDGKLWLNVPHPDANGTKANDFNSKLSILISLGVIPKQNKSEQRYAAGETIQIWLGVDANRLFIIENSFLEYMKQHESEE